MAGLNSYVTNVSPGEGRELMKKLEAAGYQLREVPHAVFGAKGEGVNVVLYRSGRLVVQGKGLADFRDFRLAEVLIQDPSQLSAAAVGADEAGKGDYFGPLVVAACALTPEIQRFLDRTATQDSKTLADSQALAAAQEIESVCTHEVIAIGPARYNELYKSFGNLNTLLAWAHAKAILKVVQKSGCKNVILDKFCDEKVVRRALGPEGRDLDLLTQPKAEQFPAVAAASVLARAGFLRHLERLGREIGTRLPKGAGAPVLAAGRALVSDSGRQILAQVAKLHFKTTQQITPRK